jgi:hypothetical protein
MIFPTLHIGHSRYGLFFTRLNCQFTAKSSKKDHDLPGIRTRDPWSSSQHTQPLHHLGLELLHHANFEVPLSLNLLLVWLTYIVLILFYLWVEI